MDVEKLNNVYENNEARFSKLEDELGEIESLLLRVDQKEDSDESEPGGEKRRRIRSYYIVDSGCESLEEASN
ncbi:15933_t:CDS:2 [Entrophospora sp. SA101]|nr:15933_t:CDS:2 [Entrophospora sp. SA101]